MKKQLLLIMMIIYLMFGMIKTVKATPMYYTFEGKPKQLSDSAGFVSLNDINMDTLLSFTFLFDFSRQGERTRFNNNISVLDDVGPIINGYEGTFDYFYVKYISGSAFSVKFTDRPYSENDDKQHNWGVIEDWSNTDTYCDNIYIRAGWHDEQLNLSQSQHSINDPPIDLSNSFKIGSVWEIDNQIDTQNNGSSLVRANVTLISISESVPIPEPSTYLLFLFGMIGMIGIKEKIHLS